MVKEYSAPKECTILFFRIMSRESLATELKDLLRERQWTLSVAESCTGGLVGGAITDIAGSSNYFRGGIIAYDNEVKISFLGVPREIIEKHGAVSSMTVVAMARGAQRVFNTDCAIATSGIAGPDGGTKEKPVGLVYVGIAVGEMFRSYEYRFTGDRNAVRNATVDEALRRLVEIVKQR